jgi:hypothetical protein
MNDRKLAATWVVLLMPLALAPAASAITPAELDCCDAMDQAVQAYFQKHIKKVKKCTLKMNESTDPASERCDDGFDAETGDTDYVVDQFGDKTLKKMKRKCMAALGLASEAAFDVHAPMPSPCTCNAPPLLQGQMECKLNIISGPADLAVCAISPAKKNANRGGAPPPGISTFCP